MATWTEIIMRSNGKMSNNQIKNNVVEKTKSCVNCGAELKYLPGSSDIVCEYCGYRQPIGDKATEKEIVELELLSYLEKMGAQSHSQKITMLQCKNCGANQHVEDIYKSLECVYCSSPLIIQDVKEEDWILPGAILPFQIDKRIAHQLFSNWIRGLWFAPNKLKKAAIDINSIKGLYLPYWTFDAQIDANYQGERGEYYYVTENYTTTENGQTVNKSRRVRKTRWIPVRGSISEFMDDNLVKASYQQTNSVPAKVCDWNLGSLKPFENDYLSGFITEKYTIPLKDGSLESNQDAEQMAIFWAKRDMGGDEQRVHNIDVHLSEQTFKHILLPVYISSYRYNGKVYNFFVNGQTGSVSGNRPYSTWKVILAVIAAIIVAVIVILFYQG